MAKAKRCTVGHSIIFQDEFMSVVASMKPNQQGDSWSNIPSCNIWMKLVLQNQRPYIVIAIYFPPTVTELALTG
jgi:hypothetical protein